MTMKVKAIEKKLKFTKDPNAPGVYRYVMQPEQYSSLTQKKVIKEAALRSGVSQGVMQACWDAAGEVIKAWATEGHSVALPGLGTMRFGLRSKSVEKVVQITCFDRDGKEVKRVTSDDSGDVEDNESGLTPSPSPTGEGSGNSGGGNSGGNGDEELDEN